MDDILSSLDDTIRGLSNRRTHEVITIDFKHQGFNCTVVRTDMGHWVGYVIEPKEHSMYNKSIDEVFPDVHGGLTYSDTLHWKDSKNYGKFALGFDFNHGFDDGGSEEEARAECIKLVKYLKEKNNED